MKPTQIWIGEFQAQSSYRAPVICMQNLPKDLENMRKATNNKDLKDTIEQDIQKLEQYIPNQINPTAFINYKNRIHVNISSTFSKTGNMFLNYKKIIEIYAQVEKPDLKDLTNLLKEKGFYPVKEESN